MKNKIITIILTIVLTLPITASAYNVPEIDIIDPLNEEEINWGEKHVELPNIESVNKPVIKEEIIKEESIVVPTQTKNIYKQPVSKKKILQKFLLAMGGVGISAILLFIFLSLYKNLKNVANSNNGYISDLSSGSKDNTLVTPTDINSAINIFLEKTKWDN